MAGFLPRLVASYKATITAARGVPRELASKVQRRKSPARLRFLRMEFLEDRSVLSATIFENQAFVPGIEPVAKVSSVISSDLRAKQAAIFREASAGVPRGVNSLSDDAVRVDSAGRVQVYVHLDAVTPERTRSLEAAGMTVESNNPDMRVVQGWVSAASLNIFAGISGVTSITPPDYAQTQTGSVNSAGDSLVNADAIRALGIDGTGVRVGVISDGVNGGGNVQATGDLPGVTVNPSLPGSGFEGTAMLEIVHDLAPGASLYFSGPQTSVDMVNSINWLVSQGVDVIIDDLAFLGEPYFQDGSIANAAATAVANGVVYVTCATNYAQQHYQGFFTPGGTQTGYGELHAFASGDIGQTVTIANGRTLQAYLEWSDAYGASGNDYDLLLVRNSDNVVIASSLTGQDGNDVPFEGISYANNTGGTLTANIRIVRYSGAARELEMFVFGASSQEYVTTADSIIGHAAADGVITVGAIDASDPGTDTIENFSSRGPSTIYTNFSNQSRILRNSLDGASIDGVQTKIGQLGYFSNPFFGTSASSPHAGAIAALLLDARPDFTPSQVISTLTSTAVDLGSFGYDDTFGYGRFDALAAVRQALNLPTYRFDFGLTNSPVEPGYTQVTLFNTYPSGGIPLTFGWQSLQGMGASYSPGSGNPLDWDSHQLNDGSFLVDVPNGRYLVEMRLGEPGGYYDQMGVYLEGVQVDNVTPPNFTGVVSRTYAVDVFDGQLSVRLRDLGGFYPASNGGFYGAAITSLVLTTTPPPAPAAPTSLTATAVSPSQINLTWQDNSSVEQGYKIERWINGQWWQIATVAANTTSYLDFGLAATTLYFYRVRAYNSTADSAYSNQASTYTLTPETIPAAPSVLDAQAASATQINLSWQDNSGNEQGFRIERKTGVGGVWNELAVVGPSTTNYQDFGLSASTTYYYRVRSYNGAGNSSYSNEAFATTPNPPPVASYYDFGTASSPVESGYTQVTPATSYPSGSSVIYGWSQAQSLTSKDSGSGNALDRDANITADGTFVVDVVNGQYQVDMRLGEVNGYHDQTGVFLEGVQVDNVTASGYRGVVARTYTVTVTDGQLTVRLRDLGGFFAGAAITSLAITPIITPPPSAPSSLSATAASSSQINLAWTDNATSEQGFKIERKTGASGTWSQIATVGANTTSYQNTSLSASTTYYYRVRAYNSTADSSYSNDAFAATSAPETIPSAPSSLNAQASSASQINLSWTDNSGNEQGFKIERKTGASGTWTQIATVGASVNTYQSTGLSPSTTYYYRVRAYNGAGDSSYSNEAFATTSVAQPTSARFDFGTPTSPVESGYLQVTPTTSYPTGTTLTYGWTQAQSLTGRDSGSSSNLDRDANITTDGTFLVDVTNGTYQVDLRIGELNAFHDQTGVSLEGVQVDNVTASGYSGVVARSFTVTVADGQLTVRLKDLGGFFAGAAITSLVITPASTPAPTAPTSLTATAASSAQINLSWTDNASSEQGFKIERKTGASGTWSEIATVGANVNTYQSAGLSANTTYYYRVRAYNGGGDSSYSNEAFATTQSTATPPANPTNLTAQATSASQINLAWTDNSGNEQGFKIERKTGAAGAWSQIDTVGANITSYQNTGLSANTTYYYRVRAYNGAGDSAYSNEPLATTSTAQQFSARFDFGTATSPVEPGYLQVTPQTSYPSGTTATYGWLQGQALTSRDAGSGSSLDRDANITTDGTFVVDVPNGSYRVEMRLGELFNSHDQTGVSLEGVQVDNVTAAGYLGVVSRTYTVTVADGKLTVGLKDLGGFFSGAAITSLVVTRLS